MSVWFVLLIVLPQMLGLGQHWYTLWLRSRIGRLRQRAAYAQALPLARRVQWLERWHWARAITYLTGGNFDLHQRQIGYAGPELTIADLLLEMGQLDEAEKLLAQTLVYARDIGAEGTYGYASLLLALATVHQKRGAVATTRPLLEQALGILCRAAPEQPPWPLVNPRNPKSPQVRRRLLLNARRGAALNGLGAVYHALGDYPAAARAYEEALALFAEDPKGTREGIGNVLNNLGGLYLEMGDLDRADKVLHRAVAHMRSTYGDQDPRYATAILNLAMLHGRKRNYPESLLLIRESLAIRAKVLGTASLEYAHALNNLACTLHLAGHHAEARPLADQALAGRKVYGEDHPLVTAALVTRAALDVAEGRFAEAPARYRELFSAERRMISRLFSIASDTQRLAYLDKVRERFFHFLSFVRTHRAQDPAAVAQAYDLVLTRKALSAEATAARRDAVLCDRHSELADRLRELSALRQQVAVRVLAGPGSEGVDAHQRLLTRWQERLAAQEVELARAIPEITLEQRLLAVDRRTVAAALPAGSALVEFVRLNLFDFQAVPARGEEEWKPARYLAFVVRSGSPDEVRLVDLGEAEPIDRLVWSFRSDLLGQRPAAARGMAVFENEPAAPAAADSGDGLRKRVFEPLREALTGVHHLILAPDGELALVPFEVLPGPDGRPLIEDHLFSYLAVGRDILRAETAHQQPGKPLVVAAPDFDLGSAGAANGECPQSGALSRDFDRSAERFSPLPGTVEEGQEVAGILGIEPAFGPDAVEARIKSAVAPRVLHLATHGFFLPDQQHEPNGTWRGGMPENPLLRSGLALAGANTWLQGGSPPAEAEDGLLTAEDVTGLDLLGTELVVLSACETGLGQVHAGEGVFGLRRAFQLAGGRTVVMSLWKVPDGPTRELMAAFYRHLRAGLPRAEALRRAQLELRAHYPHPRDWGAFILQGDPSPLPAISELPDLGARRPVEPPRPPADRLPKPESRVVYDVLDDPCIRDVERRRLLGAVCLYLFIMANPLMLSFTAGLQILPRLALPVVFFSLVYWPIALAFVLARAWDQRWCQKVRRTGDCATAEGPVWGYQVGVACAVQQPNQLTEGEVVFHVGDQAFTLQSNPAWGGFRLGRSRGTLQAADFLQEGTRLQVMHRNGRILRIEVLDKAAGESASPTLWPTAAAAPDGGDEPQAASRGPTSNVPLRSREAFGLIMLFGLLIFCSVALGILLPWAAIQEWNQGGESPLSLGVSFVLGVFLLVCAATFLQDLMHQYRGENAPLLKALFSAYSLKDFIRLYRGEISRPVVLLLRWGLYAATVGLFVAPLWFRAQEPRVAIHFLAFSSDGSRLAVACSDNCVRLFDGDNPRRWEGVRLPLPGPVARLAWSPDGRRLLASCQAENLPPEKRGGAGDRIVIVDAASGEVTHDWPVKSNWALAWAGAGNRIAWGDDNTIVLADAMTGAIQMTLSNEKGPAGLAFSPDGRRLAVGRWDGQVSICDAECSKEVIVLGKLVVAARCLAWSPDGQRLAVGGAFHAAKGDLRLWDVATGKPIAAVLGTDPDRSARGWSREIRAIAFDGSGERLASVSHGGEVIAWDGRTGAQDADLMPRAGQHGSTLAWQDGVALAWSPGGRLAVGKGRDGGTLVLLDPSTKTVLRQFQPNAR